MPLAGVKCARCGQWMRHLSQAPDGPAGKPQGMVCSACLLRLRSEADTLAKLRSEADAIEKLAAASAYGHAFDSAGICSCGVSRRAAAAFGFRCKLAPSGEAQGSEPKREPVVLTDHEWTIAAERPTGTP